MPIDWDKDVLFHLEDVFGEEATYRPNAGGSFLVKGIFDAAYREAVLLADDVPASMEYPVIGVRLSAFLVQPRQGDTLTLASSGKSYLVREVRPDGHGHVKLILNNQ